jgi:hypothetical protein
MLDFARHWTTEGEKARGVVIEAFEDLLEG